MRALNDTRLSRLLDHDRLGSALTPYGRAADNAAYVAAEADSQVTCAPCTAVPQDVQVNFLSRLQVAAAQGFPH